MTTMINSTGMNAVSKESKEINAVHFCNVVKSFGSTKALRGLNLELKQGEIHALLGPNGAGKTTAIGIMTGIRKSDSGSVSILGGYPWEKSIRLQVGLTPQESGFPDNLRVSEILDLVRSHFPEPMTDEELFARFPLEKFKNKQAGGLSGGQKRLLAVALSFIGNPNLVFLDEPTTGLDVESRQNIWKAILDYRGSGGTVVLTTHYLEEAEALASRIVVINEGKKLADGSLEQIRDLVGSSRVSYRGDLPIMLDGATHIKQQDDRVIVITRDSDLVIRSMVRNDLEFEDLQIRPANLEEAFFTLIDNSRQK